MKVCLVSYDIIGPIRNGGIGTAMTAAAEALKDAGHEVTLLYPHAATEDRAVSFWVLDFRRRGITFCSLFAEEGRLATSYLVYQWLKQRHFDVVHFHDWLGGGYWSVMAKRQGLAFSDTILVCQVHGQTYWSLTNAAEWMRTFEHLEVDFMERRAVEYADVLFSPSHYMLDFMRKRNWILPEQVFVSPNLLPHAYPIASTTTDEGGVRVPIDELVFFGRLDARKGVEIFCESVTRLLKSTGSGSALRRITFMGKEGHCGEQPTTAVISRAAASWSVPYAILNDLDVFAARQYLAQPGRLAVIASAVENSPYSVLEALAARIPFLAADVGGIAELIEPRDCEHVMFERNAIKLTEKVTSVLANGAVVARPSVSFAEARKRWLAWHDGLPSLSSPSPPRVERPPLVSVCMAHFSRPHLLRIAIESVEAQTYPRLQMVLVDDASPDAASKRYLDEIEPGFRKKGWKIIRNETEVWTGAARNLAVANADGDYVLLMDDDNVARPEEIEILIKAAFATNADVVTCQQQAFIGVGTPPPERSELPLGWMPLGPNLALALHTNCVGDLNMLVKRDVWNALGGFTTDRYGCEDWEFIVAAIVQGYRLEVVPEILFYYRQTGSNITYRYTAEDQYNNDMRASRPLLSKVDPDVALALRFAIESRKQETRNRFNLHETDGASSRIAKFPLNSGEALAEMAKVAYQRGQISSAVLLYKQALRNRPSNRVTALDELIDQDRGISSDLLADFMSEPAVYENESDLPSFIKRARTLLEAGELASFGKVVDAALERHSNNAPLLSLRQAASPRAAQLGSETSLH